MLIRSKLSTFEKVRHNSFRNIFSLTRKWDEKYSEDHRKNLEQFWRNSINKNSAKPQKGSSKYYVLSMFPYPSGKLHMGHVRVYTISDVIARYRKLLGYDVVHPMGWDAFGLPAENAAIERNVEPSSWTKNNIAVMKQQLIDLGCNFDWEREISTCDSSYYRWTQYLFVKLFKAGLAYQKMAPVNWDPVDKTVLAEEQIDENGRSWRSGAKVEKVPLKQWYIKTTAFSKSLYDGLNEVDASLWQDVISLQKEWIGECNGARFDFKLQSSKGISDSELGLSSTSLSIFTKCPESIYGASHILISPDHILNQAQLYDTGIKTSPKEESDDVQKLTIEAINPFTGSSIPLFVSKSFDFGEHLDHHLGVPCLDESEEEFAKKFGLLNKNVLNKKDGVLINSEEFSGLSPDVARSAILKKAKEINAGGYITSEKARDWLISRQRYWGTPIPVVHCPKYGAVPVAEEDLPVLLPDKVLGNNSQTSENNAYSRSPLANNHQWLKAKCSKCDCDGYGTRETDTMDTFVDSSWYFLRYLDPRNEEAPFDRKCLENLIPVSVYIGGKEHATMHLYYARFIHHFLFDLQLSPTREPFKNLLTQGMVLGQSFRLSETGKYLRPENVEKSADGKKYFEKETGNPVVTKWEKMSKSKFNGVDPQEILNKFGCDATRICILSDASPKSDRPWSDEVFVRVSRWQKRLWSVVHKFILLKNNSMKSSCDKFQLMKEESEIYDFRNRTLLQINFHMNKTFLFNTAISRMEMLTKFLANSSASTIAASPLYEQALCDLVIMLSPVAPMFASELWAGISSVNNLSKNYDWLSNVLDQTWPTVDYGYCLPMSVKVNKKEIFEVRLPMVHSLTSDQLDKEMAWKLITEDQNFANILSATGQSEEAWESEILKKNLLNYGNYKVEFEITTTPKFENKLKSVKFNSART